MQGRIVKGIGGFYYVHTSDGVYTCKAKGIFRKDRMKPLVGDLVEIEILGDEEMSASIIRIYDRKNVLIRPNVANIDQALIIFALHEPEPNFVIIDKMILQYAVYDIPVLLCFNKEDLSDEDYAEKIRNAYLKSDCRFFITSTVTGSGIEELKTALRGKTTAVAGPSGAGKSSIVNCLSDGMVMQTGEISYKLARGKHTTRHSEIFPIGTDTYIMDTPGFGSFELSGIEAEDAAGYYREFDLKEACRFIPCSHTHEPGCAVKAAVENNIISRMRYDNYVHIYNELLQSRRY